MKTWLTPERRQGFQLLTVVLATILVSLGTIAPEQVQHVLVLGAFLLQAAAGIISLLNLTVGEAANWFLVTGRATIYAAAPALAAAGVGLGIIDNATSVLLISWVSIGLTGIAAVVSIIFSQTPQVDQVPRH